MGSPHIWLRSTAGVPRRSIQPHNCTGHQQSHFRLLYLHAHSIERDRLPPYVAEEHRFPRTLAPTTSLSEYLASAKACSKVTKGCTFDTVSVSGGPVKLQKGSTGARICKLS